MLDGEELQPAHDPLCSRCGGTGFLELSSVNGDFMAPCSGDDEIRDFAEELPEQIVSDR